MRFNCANVKNEPPMMVRRFCCIGDGERLVVDLQSSPVLMKFEGAPPKLAFMRETTGPELTKLDIMGTHLVLEFERPLAMHERADITVEFYYDGV